MIVQRGVGAVTVVKQNKALDGTRRPIHSHIQLVTPADIAMCRGCHHVSPQGPATCVSVHYSNEDVLHKWQRNPEHEAFTWCC